MTSKLSPEEIRPKSSNENEKIKIDICQEIVFEDDDNCNDGHIFFVAPVQHEPVMTPSVKVIEKHGTSTDPCDTLFRRGKNYIKCTPKTMEEQDEIVDYDLDSDDEEFLSKYPGSLIEDDMEAAMHALEVSSFRFMLSNVRVPDPLAPSDGYQPDFLLAAPHEEENLDPLCRGRQMPDKPTKDASLNPKSGKKQGLGKRRNLKCIQSQPPNADSNLDLISSEEFGDSSLQDMTDVMCAVCLNDGAEDGNILVICDGCGIAVHQICYGIMKVPDQDESWFCCRCRKGNRASRPACQLCSMPGGALKMTDDGRFAHLSCALWVPETSLGDGYLLEPVVGMRDINKARWKLKCSICKERKGACIQCSNRRCAVAFHVTCAQAAQLHMWWGEMQGKDEIVRHVYCPKHPPSEKLPNFSYCPELKPFSSEIMQALCGSDVEMPKSLTKLAKKKARETPLKGSDLAAQGDLIFSVSPICNLHDHAQFDLLPQHKSSCSPVARMANGKRATQVIQEEGVKDKFSQVFPGVCCVCLNDVDDVENPLLECSGCKLTVHQFCCGETVKKRSAFTCTKCVLLASSEAPSARCSLCPVEGGFLKRAVTGEWLHLQCALWIDEIRFEHPEALDQITGVQDVSRDRLKLVCQICKQEGRGACIQCKKGGCFAAFHVTCAQLAGCHLAILPDDADAETTFHSFCCRHRPKYIWKGRYVDSLKFLEVKDLLPLSLLPAEEASLTLSELHNKRINKLRSQIVTHWQAKRERKNHFLMPRHQVALQDMVAFLPGELQLHKDPFYMPPALVQPRKRRGPRLSSSGKRKQSKLKTKMR